MPITLVRGATLRGLRCLRKGAPCPAWETALTWRARSTGEASTGRVLPHFAWSRLWRKAPSLAARRQTTRLPDRNRLISPGKRTLPHETSRRHAHRRHPHFTEKSTHLTANARFLSRPQGAQRCLLRLGHSPDSRDIEPVVGPVASQRAEMLATVQVPERDDPVIAATGQRAVIGTHLERLDCPLMRLSHSHALSMLQAPSAQHTVPASASAHGLWGGSDHHRGGWQRASTMRHGVRAFWLGPRSNRSCSKPTVSPPRSRKTRRSRAGYPGAWCCRQMSYGKPHEPAGCTQDVRWDDPPRPHAIPPGNASGQEHASRVSRHGEDRSSSKGKASHIPVHTSPSMPERAITRFEQLDWLKRTDHLKWSV